MPIVAAVNVTRSRYIGFSLINANVVNESDDTLSGYATFKPNQIVFPVFAKFKNPSALDDSIERAASLPDHVANVSRLLLGSTLGRLSLCVRARVRVQAA